MEADRRDDLRFRRVKTTTQAEEAEVADRRVEAQVADRQVEAEMSNRRVGRTIRKKGRVSERSECRIDFAATCVRHCERVRACTHPTRVSDVVPPLS